MENVVGLYELCVVFLLIALIIIRHFIARARLRQALKLEHLELEKMYERMLKDSDNNTDLFKASLDHLQVNLLYDHAQLATPADDPRVVAGQAFRPGRRREGCAVRVRPENEAADLAIGREHGDEQRQALLVFRSGPLPTRHDLQGHSIRW